MVSLACFIKHLRRSNINLTQNFKKKGGKEGTCPNWFCKTKKITETNDEEPEKIL